MVFRRSRWGRGGECNRDGFVELSEAIDHGKVDRKDAVDFGVGVGFAKKSENVLGGFGEAGVEIGVTKAVAGIGGGIFFEEEVEGVWRGDVLVFVDCAVDVLEVEARGEAMVEFKQRKRGDEAAGGAKLGVVLQEDEIGAMRAGPSGDLEGMREENA